MRIAYFTDLFLPKIDGVVTSTINFAKELGRRGHQVLIFAPEPSKKIDFEAKNVEVFFLPSIPGLIYPEFRLGRGGIVKSHKKIKEFNPDIIHFQTPITIGTQGVVLAKLMGKPLVGSFHAFVTEDEYLKLIKFKKVIPALKEFLLSLQKFYYRACDLAITPCFSLKKELSKDGFKNPIEVVHNGVDLKRITRLSPKQILKLKQKLGLGSKVVLHFGRLSEEKSIDILLRAAKLVIRKDPEVSFLLIGGGPSFKGLKALAGKLRISKQVKFTGVIGHDQLLSSGILSVAHLFATASKMENQPMAVLEAMASGLPVVGVRKAGLPELIKDNGFLAKPDDPEDLAEKILRVLIDERLGAKMKRASLKRAKEFSIEKSTDKLLALYQDLLKKKKPGSYGLFSFWRR